MKSSSSKSSSSNSQSLQTERKHKLHLHCSPFFSTDRLVCHEQRSGVLLDLACVYISNSLHSQWFFALLQQQLTRHQPSLETGAGFPTEASAVQSADRNNIKRKTQSERNYSRSFLDLEGGHAQICRHRSKMDVSNNNH